MTASAIPTVKLPSGDAMPVLGQGTWHFAENPRRRADEIAALRLGIDLGMTLIDTAEAYAHGASEELVGEAIGGRRDEVFLTTKVSPGHATLNGTITACEGSLRRLGTEVVDLYLLHWPGRVPIEETVAAFTTLVRDGKIRHWGVSNFDVDDLDELVRVEGGESVATDQVLYNLTRRGIEYDLLPRAAAMGLPIMAYSPIEQGRLVGHPALDQIAARHRATPAQVALAWVLRLRGVSAIPKASTEEHVRENRGALDIRLTEQDLAALDRAFPPPAGSQPLELL